MGCRSINLWSEVKSAEAATGTHRPPIVRQLHLGKDVEGRLNDALAGDRGLHDECEEGDHGEAAVLDLSKTVLVVRHFERVELEVARRVVRGPAAVLTRGEQAEGVEDLEKGHGEEELLHNAGLHHEVVCVERGHASELSTREHEALVDGSVTHHREHGDAAVLELGLAQPDKVALVAEAEWVEHATLGILARHRLEGGRHLGRCARSHARARNRGCAEGGAGANEGDEGEGAKHDAGGVGAMRARLERGGVGTREIRERPSHSTKPARVFTGWPRGELTVVSWREGLCPLGRPSRAQRRRRHT
mmetsp:Transcript_19337/g.45189  ORF Transcript_19337/g.45189 Transcript_19337/m.45189 type:complete len:304 (+) Transcript_19337:102-1013(+)